MRFVAIAFIIAAVPLFCVWLGQGRRQRLQAYALIGLLPFTINAWQLDAALISWAGWPGPAKGAVITLLDSLALAILITHRAPGRVTPMIGWLVLYFAAATLSIAMSDMPMASAFYAFQLVRIIILAVAVARIAPDTEGIRWLAYGLVLGITYQAGITIWQKIGGAVQATGTMGHQNLLGMMGHFVLLPLLALLLGGERNRLFMLGVISSMVAVALGASRGSVGFAGLGLALLVVLSLARRTTPHKWSILRFGALALALAAPLSYMTLENRFEKQGDLSGSSEERLAFERAANAMWSDHPMGIGANMYVLVANTRGYSDRAGVNWSSGRSTSVHNAYLLAASETGWLGLLSFVSLFAAAIATALRFAFANRRDPSGELVLGCAVAFITAAAHNLYEWIIVLYQAQYMFAISLGIVAGLVRHRQMTGARWRKRRAAAVAAASPTGALAGLRDGRPA